MRRDGYAADERLGAVRRGAQQREECPRRWPGAKQIHVDEAGVVVVLQDAYRQIRALDILLHVARDDARVRNDDVCFASLCAHVSSEVGDAGCGLRVADGFEDGERGVDGVEGKF